MRRGIGLLLILGALGVVAWLAISLFRLDFWLASPKDKFIRSWKEDVVLLQKSGKLPKEWDAIREIKITTDNSPAQDLVAGVIAPISKKADGTHRLDVFVIHWIEGTRYGVVVQYNLVDLKNQNTVWELGRTFKLGIVY